MAPVSSSEAQLAVALGFTAGAAASAVLLLVSIAAMRLWRRWRVARLGRRSPAWRDVLFEATEHPASAALPPIAAIDLPDFVLLWNRYQESIRGQAAQNLCELLRAHGIAERLLRMLRRRSLRLNLIAITALGHLREERAWPALERLAALPGPVISFAAARALLRIEPGRALEVLGPSIVARADWPISRLGTLFQQLGPAVVTPPLVTMLAGRPRQGLDRIIKLARFGHRPRVATIVRGWLGASDDPAVLCAALDFVEEAEDLQWARRAARHGDGRVRMAAARALGRVGGPGELAPLLELLRDPVWWVRYHASQSLTRLHGIERRELESLRREATDPYAADMLGQALAELARRR